MNGWDTAMKYRRGEISLTEAAQALPRLHSSVSLVRQIRRSYRTLRQVPTDHLFAKRARATIAECEEIIADRGDCVCCGYSPCCGEIQENTDL